MGSAARRCGAYGGEYMRAGLRLHARGEEDWTKYLVKLEQEKTTCEKQRWLRLNQILYIRSNLIPAPASCFYTRPWLKTCETSTSNVFLDRSAKLTSRVEITLPHDRSLDRIDRIGNRMQRARVCGRPGLWGACGLPARAAPSLSFFFFLPFSFCFLVSSLFRWATKLAH
jgi:hypothetical protein